MPSRRSKEEAFPSDLGKPALERMLAMHNAIRDGRFPNAQTLAADFGVSAKSIHRDLEYMRDRLGLPWEYDQVRHGYFYATEVGAFPTLQVTEGELFALVLAEKALQQYRGTPFEKPLRSAFAKLSASLPETISLNLSGWEESISFRTSSEPIVDLRIFKELSRAASERQQLRLLYRKPGANRAEVRIVDPYHLANVNGEWFLFAHCHLRKDVRTFVPSRIQELSRTGVFFERPARFSLEERLRDSFGVHSGRGKHQVIVRFDPSAADYVREKKWHPSQKIKVLENGAVELHLKLSSLAEIERWILGWGGRAVAIAPAELVESIRASAAALLRSCS